METLDILYITLSLGIVVLVGYLSYTLNQIAKTLKDVQPILKDIRDIADDFRAGKDALKSGFGLLSNVIGHRLADQETRKVVNTNAKKK